MIVKIKQYKKSDLHSNLTIDEELVLLIYRELYLNKPFYLSIAVDPLGLLGQYIRRIVNSLIDKGYMIRINQSLVDLCENKTNLINSNFAFSQDISIDNKRMIIFLYKFYVGQKEIDTNNLNKDIPKNLLIDLIDTLINEGVILYDEALNFENIFSLNSHYDS